MAERIILFVCCLLFAAPFLLISLSNKDRTTPIVFWSGGEEQCKDKLKNIGDYNQEMASLYRKCAVSFLLSGICSCISPMIGLAMLGLECTIGAFLVYRSYQKILKKYS